MSGDTLAAGSPPVGRTTIRPQAIRRLVEAVAGDTAGIPARRVSAVLTDEGGTLIVRVTTPVELEPRPGAGRTGLVDHAGELAEAVTVRLDELAGRSVGRVDVRITGAYRANEGRVR